MYGTQTKNMWFTDSFITFALRLIFVCIQVFLFVLPVAPLSAILDSSSAAVAERQPAPAPRARQEATAVLQANTITSLVFGGICVDE